MMRGTTAKSARRGIGLLAAALLLTVASSAAHAAVEISSGATANMACVSGVCTPTKKSAVLNVTQLEGLLASGNVKVTTAGSKATDILVSANLGWASAYGLTLDAYQSITIDRAVSVNGTGGLTLTTDDGGTGGVLSFGANGHVVFLSTANSLTINGTAYTLVADTTTLANDITSNPGGNFALASDYNATGNSSFVTSTFNGNFEGLGDTISHLTLTPLRTNANVGLFAEIGSSGTVANVRLTDVSMNALVGAAGGIAGTNYGLLMGDSTTGRLAEEEADGSVYLGGLVGLNGGSIVDSHSSVVVSVDDKKEGNDESPTGGLVGFNYFGSITASFASGNVKTVGHDGDGGLVGFNWGGSIANSYANGSSTGGAGADAGGLVGENAAGGTVTSSYSTGSATVGSGGSVGGLIGFDQQQNPNGPTTTSYWDTTTSNITNPSQGAGNVSNDPGITGLSTSQLQAGLPAGFSSAIWVKVPASMAGCRISSLCRRGE